MWSNIFTDDVLLQSLFPSIGKSLYESIFKGRGTDELWTKPEGLGTGKKMILATSREGKLKIEVGLR